MNIVKHNPFKDKTPLGAIKTNQEFELNLYIASSQRPTSCHLLINHDEKEQTLSYPMKYIAEKENYLHYSAKLSIAEYGLYFYFFSFSKEGTCHYVGNSENRATVGSFLPQWQLTIYQEDFTTPDWIKGGIIYQIFPDRFCKGDIQITAPVRQNRKIVDDWYSTPEFIYDNPKYSANDFFMGNLKGITEKLDYLKELNVTAIYLNPIFESAENHRYSTSDYKSIDPYLGTEEDFDLLAKTCHEKGIKLLLDGVFSHTGADSIYFNKYKNYPGIGAYNSVNSPYYSWYKFSSYPEQYESWWNFENLPNVKEEAPSYLDFITNKENGVLAHWLNKGCSGYRLDVIDEIPDVFLDKLRQSVKELDPENLIIGEVWEDATTKKAYNQRRRYLLGSQMDSVMNYPWKDAIINLINTKNTQNFYHEIMTIISNYPKEALNCLMNILSSHDTVRIITQLGETRDIPLELQGSTFLEPKAKEKAIQKLKLAVFLQFTLPGVPSIYYADEVGLEGFKDPYCRRGYPWGKENTQILEYYKTLSNIRHQNPEAFKGDFEFLHLGEGTLIYKRETLTFIINLNENTAFIDKKILGTKVFGSGQIQLTPLGILVKSNSVHIIKNQTKE